VLYMRCDEVDGGCGMSQAGLWSTQEMVGQKEGRRKQTGRMYGAVVLWCSKW
jgi:hypothetical protein